MLTTPQHNNNMTKTKPKLKKVTYKYSKTGIKKIAELLKEDDSLKVYQYYHDEGSILQVEKFHSKITPHHICNKVLIKVHSQKTKSINAIFLSATTCENIDILSAAERGVGIHFVRYFNPETKRFDFN